MQTKLCLTLEIATKMIMVDLGIMMLKRFILSLIGTKSWLKDLLPNSVLKIHSTIKFS
jgi:hypothetical protein